jgi:DNA-binding transcriptional MerR regulator
MSQDKRDERCYGIEELAELGRVTRRTVRYYVQRGLLPTPLGTGRGPHYTPAHLERLIHIRKLQETGVPLAEVAARLDGVPQIPVIALEPLSERSTSLRASSPPVLPEGGTWMRFVLADGVELHVRAGTASLQPSQLVRVVEAAQQALGLQTASHLFGRSNTHERNTAQLSGDVEPCPDPTSGGTH